MCAIVFAFLLVAILAVPASAKGGHGGHVHHSTTSDHHGGTFHVESMHVSSSSNVRFGGCSFAFADGTTCPERGFGASGSFVERGFIGEDAVASTHHAPDS